MSMKRVVLTDAEIDAALVSLANWEKSAAKPAIEKKRFVSKILLKRLAL